MSKDNNNFDQNQSTNDYTTQDPQDFDYESQDDFETSEDWDVEEGSVNDQTSSRPFSRQQRNKPLKEASTMSRVILFSIVLISLSPFVLYLIVNSMRPDEPKDVRTTNQIQLEKSSQESESKDKESDESESSQRSDRESQENEESSTASVNTRPVNESQAGSQQTQPGTQPNEASSQTPPAPSSVLVQF